jgi:hypothetical protein
MEKRELTPEEKIDIVFRMIKTWTPRSSETLEQVFPKATWPEDIRKCTLQEFLTRVFNNDPESVMKDGVPSAGSLLLSRPTREEEFLTRVKDLVALCPPPKNSATSGDDLEAILTRPKSEELIPARRWVETLWTIVGPDWKMAHYSDVCKGLSPVSLMDPGNPPLKLSGRLMIRGQEPVVLYDPQGRVVAIIPRDIYEDICNT